MKDIWNSKNYPMTIVIAPSHDLRAKCTITVENVEQILNAQRNRYELIEVKA